jgi:NADP-dependent 3-hydroxy acid dehydrogenase YdfG
MNILITGGSKGIGLGIAAYLKGNGYNVAITGRSSTSLDEAISRLQTIETGNVLSYVADVRDMGRMTEVANDIENKWGGIDVLVANAGLGHFGSIEDLTLDQWNETIGINLTGVFVSIKACLPALKKSEGYIITISSLAGTNFFAGGSAYNASKFGLTGFTQAAMLDLRHQGIKVLTIMPGSVTSYFNGHIPNQADSWKIQPEDIGEIVYDVLQLNPRTLPSKIEVRPSKPPKG